MPLDDAALLAALRGARSPEAVCRAAGVPLAEFVSARDAWLARHAALGDRTLPGRVGATVDILRDRAGIPHIFAAGSTDLYFGLGFAMAQDRLWQMDRLRRRALGQQAEILGPDYAAADEAHLTIGLDAICTREAAAIDPATGAVVEAMVAGINRFIEAAGDDLPVEFRLLDYRPAPFTPRCVVAIARGFWWSLNGRIDRLSAAECAGFFPEPLRTSYLTPEAADNVILPGAPGTPGVRAAGTDDATGSNNWAISGSRTGTGAPMVCGDPHQPFWVPSSWYEFGRALSTAWWLTCRRPSRSWRSRISAIPACPAAPITATSSNPGGAASTMWCISGGRRWTLKAPPASPRPEHAARGRLSGGRGRTRHWPVPAVCRGRRAIPVSAGPSAAADR